MFASVPLLLPLMRRIRLPAPGTAAPAEPARADAARAKPVEEGAG